jgi:iron complex transport system ATP-binding protein
MTASFAPEAAAPFPAAVRRAVILSGARGSGKTSLCMELAKSRSDYAGIVCPNLLDGRGMEIGKSALCISSGESWRIARLDAELGGPRLGRFSFSAEGLERAAACLHAAILMPDRICVIDEVGPLELDRDMGLAPVLPLLSSAGRLLIVVRPGLEERVSALIPRHERRSIVLRADIRGEAAREIDSFLRQRLL